MHKSRHKISLVIAIILMTYPVTANAGTYMLGTKVWFVSWESAVLDWFEQDLKVDFASTGRRLHTSKDDGAGYLAGPLMSYQTGDGNWSFSLAPMMFSTLSQDWQGIMSGMSMASDVDMDRIDIDFAANYRLNKFMSAFVGYKYQEIDIDLTLTYATNMGSITNLYKLDQKTHIPTAGASFYYMVHEKAALVLQLGLLYTIPDISMTDMDGKDYYIWTRPTFGFNGEFIVNYKPLKNLILQSGYRYQYFRLDAIQQQTFEKTESDDISHGLTLTAVWIF